MVVFQCNKELFYHKRDGSKEEDSLITVKTTIRNALIESY